MKEVIEILNTLDHANVGGIWKNMKQSMKISVF